MILDYHMHLRDPDERIVHSLETVERLVEAAAARGVDEIGFTEHVYYFREPRSLGRSYQWSAASTTWRRTSTRCWRPSGGACRSSSGSRSTTSATGRTSSRPSWGLPVGLPAGLRALGRRTRSRPGPGRCGRSSGRRGLAALLRRPGRARLLRARRRARASRPRQDLRRPARIGIEYPLAGRRGPRDLDRGAPQARRGAVPGGGDPTPRGAAITLPRTPTSRGTSAATSTARSARTCGRLRDRDRLRGPQARQEPLG